MCGSTKRAIIILMCVCVLILSGIGSSSLWNNNGSNTATADSGIYYVEELNSFENRFVNQVDGYGISIPKEMRVVDMSFPGIRSVLEDEHRRVEIYKELTDQGVPGEIYINYSNRFLTKQSDHLRARSEKLFWKGMKLHVAQWSREKLIKLDDDKNYYACIDIMTKEAVYTFFFKSDLPLENCGGYMDIINDFYTFTPSQKADTARFKHVEKRNWNLETTQAFEKYFAENSKLSWGIFEHSTLFHMEDLHKLEQKIDYDFPIILLYSHVKSEYDPCMVGQVLQRAYDDGKMVELTLQTSTVDEGEHNMVYDILNGKYDGFLNAYAKDVVDFAHPVLFRPFNEMNGDWCAYSAYHTSRDTDLFKEVYKYIYNIFEDAGADNVIWVWNPNEKSFPNFKWNNEIMYYPGDKYVDVVGLTGYNTGTYYKGETWRSFTQIYDPLYQKAISLYDKPMMITEFACSSIGLDKEQWVADMFKNISRYPNIKIAIWWNGCDFDSEGNIARPYFMDETKELLTIFKENLRKYRQ